jgi:hypothetical protein
MSTQYTIPAGRYGDTSTAFIQAYIDQKIAGVIDLAPETLNSLNELAAAINDDPAFYATIAGQVAELNTDVTDAVTALGVGENDTTFGTFTAATLPDGVTLKAVLEAFASAYETTKSNLEGADSTLSGRIDALEVDPTTATAVQTVQDDVDQNELDSDAADLALSNRLDALEADPTTQTYVDGINTALDGRLDTLELDPTTQTLLDAETTAREGGDSALSGRLDTLEADPTTATAVAAVQSDVDQNEADADAAIALKLNIADPAATGKLTVDTSASLEFDSNLTKVHNELRGTRIDVGNNITVYPAAAGGRFEIEGGLYIRLSDLEEHNNDTDAANAGIVVGGVYYDGNGHLRIRVS